MPEGEFELIDRLAERLPTRGRLLRVGTGDDAAVLEAAGEMVVSVDALIDGVHFTLPEFSHRAIGRKALAAALSDLAAMGAEAGEALVLLGVPADAAEEDLLELAEGLGEVARREGVAIAGGDVSRAPALLLSVTALGREPADSPLVTRAGARPGDRIVVTGELGGAGAALRLLEPRAGIPSALSASRRDRLLARQLDPVPRLAAGVALAREGATAMIDVSDGLAADAGHLAEAGAVRLEIDLERVPVADGVAEVASGEGEAGILAASGGEDFELLASLPADRVDAARRAVESAGCPLSEIGVVAEGTGAVVRDLDGRELELAGYDHLRRPSRA